jgi:hypothetical protein
MEKTPGPRTARPEILALVRGHWLARGSAWRTRRRQSRLRLPGPTADTRLSVTPSTGRRVHASAGAKGAPVSLDTKNS